MPIYPTGEAELQRKMSGLRVSSKDETDGVLKGKP